MGIYRLLEFSMIQISFPFLSSDIRFSQFLIHNFGNDNYVLDIKRYCTHLFTPTSSIIPSLTKDLI